MRSLNQAATLSTLASLVLSVPVCARAQQASGDVCDQFHRYTEKEHRAFFQEMPGETMDPFTGTLRIVREDPVLSGKAGLDLHIIRAYSTRIWGRADVLDMEPLLAEKGQSVLGYGWTFPIARTPWTLEFTDNPTVSRIGWGDRCEDLDNRTDCYRCFDSPLPVGEVMTLTGTWLAKFDWVYYWGPTSAWIPYAWGSADREPLTQFSVLDDQHIELRIDAHPSTDRVLRARVSDYCDCNGLCWSPGAINDRRRGFQLEDSRHNHAYFEMNPAGGWVRVMAAGCESEPPDDDQDPEIPPNDDWRTIPLPPGSGDSTNTFCG